MAFRYFLGNSVQSRLKKGIPSFDKSSFNFSFLFYKQLNMERCAAFWLNTFFRKIVVNVHNRVRENGGRMLIMLIGWGLSEDKRLRIWSCRIASCLESDESIESALWYNLTLIGSGVDLLTSVEKSNRMAEWSEERLLFRVRFWILLKITVKRLYNCLCR